MLRYLRKLRKTNGPGLSNKLENRAQTPPRGFLLSSLYT